MANRASDAQVGAVTASACAGQEEGRFPRVTCQLGRAMAKLSSPAIDAAPHQITTQAA